MSSCNSIRRLIGIEQHILIGLSNNKMLQEIISTRDKPFKNGLQWDKFSTIFQNSVFQM